MKHIQRLTALALVAIASEVSSQTIVVDSVCSIPLAAAIDTLSLKPVRPSHIVTQAQIRQIVTLTAAYTKYCSRVVTPPPQDTVVLPPPPPPPPPDTTPDPAPPPNTGRVMHVTVRAPSTQGMSGDTLYQIGLTWIEARTDSAGIVLSDSAAINLSNPSAVSLRWGKEGRRWVLSSPTVAGPLIVKLTNSGLTVTDTITLVLSSPPLPPTPTPVQPPANAVTALKLLVDVRPPTTNPPYQQTDQLWSFWEPKRWAADGFAYGAANYYDRALAYYIQWIRHGDTTYKRRADLIALDYRVNYLEKNNYQASARWAQLDGVAMHWFTNQDSLSLKAIAHAGHAVGLIATIPRGTGWLDAREQARGLEALLLGWQTNAPLVTNGQLPWSQRIDVALNHILSFQDADGGWRYPGTCDKTLNYMNAMMARALGRVYDQYRADARIPVAIQKTVDYLWNTQWQPNAPIPAFGYYEAPVSCNGPLEGPNATPDLTGIFAPAFAWMARRDAGYIPKLHALVTAANRGVYPQGSKQWNEFLAVLAGQVP